MMELRAQALECLRETSPMLKVAHVAMLANAYEKGQMAVDPGTVFVEPEGLPGRPQRPELVAPRELANRGISTPQGRAALLHSLAHIEFNAINLALDAVWRFAAMPDGFYGDWLNIASDEAYHFCLIKDRVEALGYEYGSFPAHNGLWDMAERTRGNLLARMALVPRTLEARGLDVTPGIRAKFKQIGDDDSANALDIILRDEVRHVATGNAWYRWLCTRTGRDPRTAHDELAEQFGMALPHPPFNDEARIAAGFLAEELDAWRGPIG